MRMPAQTGQMHAGRRRVHPCKRVNISSHLRLGGISSLLLPADTNMRAAQELHPHQAQPPTSAPRQFPKAVRAPAQALTPLVSAHAHAAPPAPRRLARSCWRRGVCAHIRRRRHHLRQEGRRLHVVCAMRGCRRRPALRAAAAAVAAAAAAAAAEPGIPMCSCCSCIPRRASHHKSCTARTHWWQPSGRCDRSSS